MLFKGNHNVNAVMSMLRKASISKLGHMGHWNRAYEPDQTEAQCCVTTSKYDGGLTLVAGICFASALLYIRHQMLRIQTRKAYDQIVEAWSSQPAIP